MSFCSLPALVIFFFIVCVCVYARERNAHENFLRFILFQMKIVQRVSKVSQSTGSR